MKFIRVVDEKWHVSAEELPPMSTEVEFMDVNGKIHLGEIYVEMSGHYVWTGGNWGSFDTMVKWRFIPGKKYPMYEQKKQE